jgi:DAPG hydrolase-like protein
MFRRRLPLPPPRQLPWQLKPLQSAHTSVSYDEFGRMVMRIRHDILKDVTPAMVAWWFRNIAGDMQIQGEQLNRYLVWHPHDHIRWELAQPGPDGGASAGAKFRIVEAFGRNPDFYFDVTETVTRLDDSGMTIEGYRLGQQVTRLNHDFSAVQGGTLYVSSLTIGITMPILKDLVNPLIYRAIFPEAMGRAWLKHNVEEVGLLEHIIPLVYPRAHAAA